MSRASTLYASAYDTERLHELRIRKGAQRRVTIDMNGAIPNGVSISSVSWDAGAQCVVSVSADVPESRSFAATISGITDGNGDLSAVAVLSNGEVSVQSISVWVK